MLAALFPGRDRWLLAGVFGVSVVAAFFETMGVASILPFVAFVMDPRAIDRYPALQGVLRAVGVTSQRGGLFFFGIATVVVLGLGNAAAAVNAVVQERFGARTKSRLSAALFDGYLKQPYAFHVHRDAPSLIKVLTIDVPVVVNGVIAPFLVAISRILVVIGILTLLFLRQPVVALTIGVVLGVAYSAVFFVSSRAERRLGRQFNQLNLERQRVAQETLGGVKELQVLGREAHAIALFEALSVSTASAEASNREIAQLPRYILETLAFGGILLVMLAIVADTGGATNSMVALLALYALAGHRLLPALQQVYASVITIRFYLPTLAGGLHDDYALVSAASISGKPARDLPTPTIHFAESIRLEKVTFSYSAASAPVLRDVTLVIRPNESVGFVGRTGSGKTTLADLILGFYEPSAGRISVDGVPLVGTAIRGWRRHVGYVPQHVFLANASVAANIAFGVPAGEIDADAVRQAARLAQAEEFIAALQAGFETVVGERGVKLSGGQRQRLGIARALYHKPAVLVFDEATSALDGLTEDAVMEAIRSLSGERTVILIAHRLRTVEACDRIVMLDEGRVVAEGSYHTLLTTSDAFARFTGSTIAEPSSLEA
jgi:ABC-type multidrug transport system fused ATPase/permease subunit